MSETKPKLKWWLLGLGVFAVVILLGIVLRQSSDFGIVDHQVAATAERVNEIQANWRSSGVRGLAILAMAGDLVFIGIYSYGAWMAGRSLTVGQSGLVRALGSLVVVAALVFCVTDYAETVLQFVQLVSEQGSDAMAGVAATVQPWKVAAWLFTFFGVLAALVVRRFSRTPA